MHMYQWIFKEANAYTEIFLLNIESRAKITE
jgi:hypothetical protein